METMNKFGSSFAIFTFLAVAVLLTATVAYAQAMPTLPPCYNGVQDEGESGVDCGGNCAYGQHFELCDAKDNDKDCLVDEGGVCPVTPAAIMDDSEVFEKPKAQPIPVPERMPDGPIPDYIVYNGTDEAVDNAATAHSSGVEAAVPATPAPESAEVANGEGKQSKGEAAKPVVANQNPQPSKPINDESKVENLPKPVVKPQAQSFFSKMKGFFKRFFG